MINLDGKMVNLQLRIFCQSFIIFHAIGFRTNVVVDIILKNSQNWFTISDAIEQRNQLLCHIHLKRRVIHVHILYVSQSL